jgi:hypothetical protein
VSKQAKVITTFYAKGKAVWTHEWYEKLSDEKIEKEIKYIASIGYGAVDTVTDTTGRLVRT